MTVTVYTFTCPMCGLVLRTVGPSHPKACVCPGQADVATEEVDAPDA